MGLNKHFDKIFLINLDRRTDRLRSATEQFEKYGISGVERFPAIDGSAIDKKKYATSKLKTGEIGLILSNIEILKTAKERGYQKILILEDDILFSDEILNIDYYFDAIPDGAWDMLYLSANHNSHVRYTPPPQVVNEKVLRLVSSFTTHAIGIKSSMFDVILAEISKFELPLDVAYVMLQKRHNVLCFKGEYGAIATQQVNKSDILNQDNVDYCKYIR